MPAPASDSQFVTPAGNLQSQQVRTHPQSSQETPSGSGTGHGHAMTSSKDSFVCDIKGCKSSPRHFPNVASLARHRKSAHRIAGNGEVSATSFFFCSEPGCNHGRDAGPLAGFNRKDNLMDDVRRKHKKRLTSASATAIDVSGGARSDSVAYEVESEYERGIVSLPAAEQSSKRRRIFDSARPRD
ncbi:MAG: hypothetical protein Q9160_009292 [Pyrenula sp. 1 TL-2023]